MNGTDQKKTVHQDKTASGVESFHAAYGDVPQLHSRMLLMYERFEQALAALLATDTGAAATDPAPRLAAAQLVSLLRLTTTDEAREHITSRPKNQRGQALLDWIDQSGDLLAAGLAHYAVKRDLGVPEQDRPT